MIAMDLFSQVFEKFSSHNFFFQQNDATVVQRGLKSCDHHSKSHCHGLGPENTRVHQNYLF